jgi:glutathione-regulated potassium-efflux system ancillary protein KefG
MKYMKIMVILAHPNFKESRANQILINELSKESNVFVRNLYQEYPNWIINIENEQQLLLEYDRIVFQFPFYWYSCPPLLKKWFDDVMQFGWAFGPGGENLKGKEFILATTTGGPKNAYQAGGGNWYTISEFFKPIQATIMRCNGTFLPTFITYNADKGSEEYLLSQSKKYKEHLYKFREELIH